MRDLRSNVKTVIVVAPASRNASLAAGTAVDLRGFGSAMIVIQSGAITSGTGTNLPKMQESVDGSTWTDVGTAELQGAFGNLVADAVQSVGYVGTRRYIRVGVTLTGTATMLYSGIAVLGHPDQLPAG